MMLYLFCSAAAPLYKRDALEVISYPSGHIFRFRYANRYVHPDILRKLERYEGKPALLVFLDTVGTSGSMDFMFYPLRTVTMLRVQHTANAIYFDFRLGDFVHYESGDARRDLWNGFFRQLSSRPWPPPTKSGRSDEGYFVCATENGPPEFTTASAIPYENWNSVVSHLDKTVDLAKSTFCLILGFFQVRRLWWTIDIFKFGRRYETRLKPMDDGFDTVYPVPMGKSVVLKMLLSRPSFDYADPKSARILTMVTGGDTFSGMSKSKIQSESRYNEDRTLLVCKRVFDTVLATVSIEESGIEEIRSPRLTLLTRVRVPRFVIGSVVGGVALSAFLFAIDTDVIRFLASFFPSASRDWMCINAKSIVAIAKLISPAPVAVSAYVAFRKLPIK